ncbi:hypothetical protein CPT_Madawaska_122 [Staphylococcus phage Madawaska]|nr:hypothetical protein CPT_Madawaska_122 [Staphylococcus phage Madawaska]
MDLKENKFYYNKDINELFIIGKDESDINDKINKFYYKKLLEKNLDYHGLINNLYYNRNINFDLMDDDDIYFSNMYNGIREYIKVSYVEFSCTNFEDNEVILQLDTFIDKSNDKNLLEVHKNSHGVTITMVKGFYEKDLINYNEYKNILDKLSGLFDTMLKEENDGNIKIFINDIDIFEPYAYFRELEDERGIKNILVKKNFI